MSPTGTSSTIQLADGTKAFRKALSNAPEGFFQFEAAGLEELRQLGARVPEVYEVTDQHLITQLITAESSAEQVRDPEYTFGRQLAGLHRKSQETAEDDQTFGSLPGLSHWYLGAAAIDLQPTSTLYESLVTNRIVPLTEQAVEAGLLDSAALKLARRIIPEHLGAAEPATVVHGDLWAGNRMVDSSGASWLIDPSCHWGHREQDIAMMHLFGGFGPEVMTGYADAFPLAEGWQERIPVFQLVPLLVHVLLFGSGYATPTMHALTTTVEG